MVKKVPADQKLVTLGIYGGRGPFLERPGNFSGPKSNIQIEI